MASHNDNGYFHFEAQNLPENAKILIFDDSSESCQNAITGNACEGRCDFWFDSRLCSLA